jgi:hypothetical protein
MRFSLLILPPCRKRFILRGFTWAMPYGHGYRRRASAAICLVLTLLTVGLPGRLTQICRRPSVRVPA